MKRSQEVFSPRQTPILRCRSIHNREWNKQSHNRINIAKKVWYICAFPCFINRGHTQTQHQNATRNTTSERYSDFENGDLMLIISVLEEFPQALHKIPQLKYIVRRIDTENRGISSARPGRGSIEFAESIFLRGSLCSS